MNDGLVPQMDAGRASSEPKVLTALDGLLDLDEGLRDILLGAQCGAHVGRVVGLMDVEAGLADILDQERPPGLLAARTKHDNTRERHFGLSRRQSGS